MKLDYTQRSLDVLKNLPAPLRKAFYKQAGFLVLNIWQARVNRDWRFYFIVHGDTYTITNITPHPK